MGMEAKSYQRSAVAIGKACQSGLTIAEFNHMYATKEQTETPGYDETKINGGLVGVSIKDNHEKEYPDSYSTSFATGVETKVAGWGAFISGLNNISAADGAATFGNNNENEGINAFVAGASNKATVPKAFLFGENLKQTTGNGNSFVIGSYNDDQGDYIFAIGGGSDNNRRNLLTVDRSSGKMVLSGSIEAPFTSVGWEAAPREAVVNRGILSDQLATKSNATNWRNGAGTATVVTNGGGNSSEHDNCIVGGVGNKTSNNEQTIFGKYASNTGDALFKIGCGTNTKRKDALSISKNGVVTLSSYLERGSKPLVYDFPTDTSNLTIDSTYDFTVNDNDIPINNKTKNIP